jgi:hypothetical protein
VSSFALPSVRCFASVSAMPCWSVGRRPLSRLLSASSLGWLLDVRRPWLAQLMVCASKIGERSGSCDASLKVNPKAICLGAAHSAAMSRLVALCAQSALFGSRLGSVAASALLTAQGPNTPLEGTAGKHSLPVPSALRAPAAPQLRRWASTY